jgi:hypothetical protein
MPSEHVSGKSDLILSQGEKIKLIIMYALIAVATLLGFAASVIVGNLSVLLAGLGIVSYVLVYVMPSMQTILLQSTTRRGNCYRKRSVRSLSVCGFL